MKSKDKQAYFILIRYIIGILIAALFIYSDYLYSIFFNFTIIPLNFILSLFYETNLTINTIQIQDNIIQIIPACVAISAYLLLFLLNITTKISIKKRILALVFSFSLLLFFNIVRLVILSILFLTNNSYFDIVHKFFWYFLSTLLVVLIWFLTTLTLKIKNIPIYTDFKTLINLIKYS